MERKPYTCPVCYGSGVVPDRTLGGTTSAVLTRTCPGCHGACIVWPPGERAPGYIQPRPGRTV